MTQVFRFLHDCRQQWGALFEPWWGLIKGLKTDSLTFSIKEYSIKLLQIVENGKAKYLKVF